MRKASLLLLGLLAAPGRAEAQARPPAIELPRTSAEIRIDGELSDPGWKDAAVADTFWETSPGDNTPAKVETVAYLVYDQRFFYIGVRCDDPQPQRIRAPYVERDQVIGTDDNIAVFLDTRNDRRSAIELRVSPRGIQADGSWNDANFNEDFSPDFFYDTAARITAQGWSAEFRIPFSSLRYPDTDPQTWGILIWRNYPREYRYARFARTTAFSLRSACARGKASSVTTSGRAALCAACGRRPWPSTPMTGRGTWSAASWRPASSSSARAT